MEEPGRLQSMGSWRVGQNWATSFSLFTFLHWKRKWQPTPVFLPGESWGQGSLVGCHLWGHHIESDTTEATQQIYQLLCRWWEHKHKCGMVPAHKELIAQSGKKETNNTVLQWENKRSYMTGIAETLKCKFLTMLGKDKVSIQKRMTSDLNPEW